MMQRIGILRFLAVVLILTPLFPQVSLARDPTQKEIIERLEKLEQQQISLEQQLKVKDERIHQLENKPQKNKQDQVPPEEIKEEPREIVVQESKPKKTTKQRLQALAEHPIYTGAKLFENDWVQLNFTPYAYVRYLNQLGIDPTWTDTLDRTFNINRQNSFQLAKVQLQFKGWLGLEKFRYYLYTWTSNASMGEGAQVVVGGNLSYLFDPHFQLGLGIAALPTTRSTRGTFPFWLRVDARPMADEYFRGSYTTGIYAWGDIIKNLHYKTMLGNNLSQLGVSQSQLDEGLNTVATSLWWTTDNFGAYEGMDDFAEHEQLAATAGVGYTHSRETQQSQPGKNAPENTQIRLSDGTSIFDPNALGVGTQVNEATYQMNSYDVGIKYRGFDLSFDYFFRWINNLDATGPIIQSNFFDHGLQAQGSYMLIKRLLQVYGFGSTIFGEFGTPWETGGGFNVFPFKSKGLRVNAELNYVRHSAVGYAAYPLAVGANGPIFMTNVEMHY